MFTQLSAATLRFYGLLATQVSMSNLLKVLSFRFEHKQLDSSTEVIQKEWNSSISASQTIVLPVDKQTVYFAASIWAEKNVKTVEPPSVLQSVAMATTLASVTESTSENSGEEPTPELSTPWYSLIIVLNSKFIISNFR